MSVGRRQYATQPIPIAKSASLGASASARGQPMSTSQMFVVPLDFSPETESTVSAALALARHCEAEVHLIEVVAPRPPSLLDEKRSYRDRRRVVTTSDWSRLETLVRAAERRRITVRAFAYRGDPTEIIPAYLLLVKSTLLVIGQHYGTSGWRRSARFVSTLSRAAPVPVLILPPGYRSRTAASSMFRHIVSAVDFSIASAVTVRTVVDLSRRSGARLTLVHALNEPPIALSGGEAVKVRRNVRAQVAQVGARLRKKVPTDVQIRIDEHVTTSDPHRAILDVASQVDADLIVMGVAPRSRFDEMLAGSTLRNVLRRTKIPVLVLPVPAGTSKWLDHTDRVEIALTQKQTGRLDVDVERPHPKRH